MATQDDTNPTLATLKALPNLKSLELRFSAPDKAEYSPWHQWGWDEADNYRPGNEYNNLSGFGLPCQAKLTEWVLCYAAEDIVHIKSIYLSGYIKTDIKKKWDAVFSQYKTPDLNLLAFLNTEKIALRSSEP